MITSFRTKGGLSARLLFVLLVPLLAFHDMIHFGDVIILLPGDAKDLAEPIFRAANASPHLQHMVSSGRDGLYWVDTW